MYSAFTFRSKQSMYETKFLLNICFERRSHFVSHDICFVRRPFTLCSIWSSFSAQFALKVVNAQCVYVNLACCAEWQTGNSDPALLILLTFNITSRIKNKMIPAIILMNIFGKYVNVYVKWTVNIILARLWNVVVAVVGFETGNLCHVPGRAVTCYKPRPVIRSMYELTFTFHLADLIRYEVRSKERSDHLLACTVFVRNDV